MKRINLIVVGLFIMFNLHANDDLQNMQNIDKLDMLDKQSKEFFNAITGLEKNYLEEQVNAIKNKKVEPYQSAPNQQAIVAKEEPKISQEDYEKNVFTHQNEMARLTTDFTRTKKLKDLKIKSMYSFNGKDYVVLELIDAVKTIKNELSANIEGRYIEGDSILGHKIIDINTRTKSVELYKQLDEEYGYTIYLSNYGISVSDLEKIKKPVEIKKQTKKTTKEKKEIKTISKNEVPEIEVLQKIKSANKLVKEEVSNCLYTVKKENLNVRNNAEENATILRVLKINDEFTIKEKIKDWAEIETIYKKISGDIMDVSKQSNWVQILEETVSSTSKNCI